MDILEQRMEEKMTPELVEDFLTHLSEKGRSQVSIKEYRRALSALHGCLPERKQITAATGSKWRRYLEGQGFSPRTVSARMSVWNSLVRYLGHRDWQVEGLAYPGEDVQPELTRTEYLRLLSTARLLGQERAYLLIKVLGGMGLRLSELPLLTAQAVRQGKLCLGHPGGEGFRILHLPAVLQKELLEYLGREGIREGSVFVTSGGKPMDRSNIGHCIKRISHDARVPEEKASPRCLWKMYLSTQKGIRDNVAVLIEQAYERMLEQEQLVVGWEGF